MSTQARDKCADLVVTTTTTAPATTTPATDECESCKHAAATLSLTWLIEDPAAEHHQVELTFTLCQSCIPLELLPAASPLFSDSGQRPPVDLS